MKTGTRLVACLVLISLCSARESENNGQQLEGVDQYAPTQTHTHTLLYLTPLTGICYIYRVIRNDCRGFNNWPPRSPDATPCHIFLWGYVKDQVYVPPLPASIPELKVRIRTAIETITADMLQTV